MKQRKYREEVGAPNFSNYYIFIILYDIFMIITIIIVIISITIIIFYLFL